MPDRLSPDSMHSYNRRAVEYLLIFNVAVAIFFTVLRCYSRAILVRKFWIDDWLALVTTV